MQRLTYVIVSIVLVTCIALSFTIKKDRSECNQDTSTSSEEAVDESDSQIIESSSQETSQEEIIISKPETNNSVITSSIVSNQTIIQEFATPSTDGSFKSYTNYKLLNHRSPQWTKIQCNENAYTDENGLRKVGEYYCVAMGSYYTKTLGDLFEIQTEYGSFKVIICDFKSDTHTDVNNQYTLHNGCVVEFYVDTVTLHPTAKKMGNISYVNDNFKGKIVAVNKLGNYFGE